MYLSGGLGNQIFQYHAGKFFSLLLGKRLILDLRNVSRAHSTYDVTSFKLGETIRLEKQSANIKEGFSIANHINGYINKRKTSHLVDEGFEKNILVVKDGKIRQTSGYFQSFIYFQQTPEFNLELQNPSPEYLRLRERHSSRNLAVHIRRGDFLGQSKTHGVLSIDYYLECIRYSLGTDTSINCVTYFTDDPELVRESIRSKETSGCDSRIIGPRDLIDPAESWVMMRDSSTLIVSNSTFSITAAMHSNGRVLIPKPLTRNEGFKEIETTMPFHYLRHTSIWC
jgi:hypothetical protein